MILTISATLMALLGGFILGKRSKCDLNFEVSFSNGQRLFFMGGNNKNDIIHKISKLLAEIKELEEKEEQASEHSKAIGDLLYHLTDLMHDSKVFEKFTAEELSEIFTSARMLTRYHSNTTSTNDIISFILKLREDIFPKLYPSCQDAGPAMISNKNIAFKKV